MDSTTTTWHYNKNASVSAMAIMRTCPGRRPITEELWRDTPFRIQLWLV
jgi:hypothetical protein